MFGEIYDIKISNLMILYNLGIDNARMLLAIVFGFIVYWKIAPNSQAFSRFQQHLFTMWLQSGHVNVFKKTKFDVREFDF